MNKLPENITYDLIAAYLNGEANEEQSLMLHVWINASTENQTYFDELKSVWEKTGSVKPTPIIVDTNNAWAKVSSRIEIIDKQKASVTKRFYLNQIIRIAAILIPPLIFAWFFLLRSSNPTIHVAATTTTIQDTLPDHSTISLNAKSSITYSKEFTGETREVNLSGEAFFEVTPDSTKPFIVHSGDASIKVLGTSFNVKAYDNSDFVEVFVNTGKVKLYGKNDSNSVVLLAGSKGVYNKFTREAKRLDELNSDELFWINRTLIFSKTDLKMVSEILSQYYNVTIVMHQQDLFRCRLSATFRDQPIDTIIDIIAKSFDLTVTKKGSVYEFDGQGCE